MWPLQLPHLDQLASLGLIQCIRIHSFLKYGIFPNMWLTWVFSLVDSAYTLRNGIPGSKLGQVLVAFEELWCRNSVIFGETAQRCPWEVASGHIRSSMWVIPVISARQALVPQSIFLVPVISGIFHDLVRNSEHRALLVLLVFQRIGNRNCCLGFVRSGTFHSNSIVKGILNTVMDNSDL
jgi:hypothetical protein